MKKSFITTFVLLLFVFFMFPFSTGAQPTVELPMEREDESIEDQDALLPPKDGGEEEPIPPMDFGEEPPSQTPTTPPGTTTNPPVSRNENPPGPTDPYLIGQQFGNSAGQILGQAAQPAPTSVSFLDRLVPPSVLGDGTGNPLNTILNQLLFLGLVVAVVLALVMIVRGGVEYMTVDAVASKESGKKRVQAALGGLLLAFSTIVILNTINPNITELNVQFPGLKAFSEIQLEKDIEQSVSQYLGMSDQQYQEYLASGKIPSDISPQAQKILAEALNSVGTLKTGTIQGTEGGKLACAAAVNRIVETATGQQVGGGLSTANMYTALKTNPRFSAVPGGIQNARPGDIIISPTSGDTVGHVGIIAGNGGSQIISNSSSQRQVLQNYNASSWDARYGSKKGLPVYIYRPN